MGKESVGEVQEEKQTEAEAEPEERQNSTHQRNRKDGVIGHNNLGGKHSRVWNAFGGRNSHPSEARKQSGTKK